MKQVYVVAGVIYRQDQILITQRKGGEFDGMWEFPGGKIEAGETHRETLERELKEELSVQVSMEEFLMKVSYQYSTFHLNMTLYWAQIQSGTIKLNEHQDMRWVSKDELLNVHWVPADVEVAEVIMNSKFL